MRYFITKAELDVLARTAHNVNHAFCANVTGDVSVPWEEASLSQQLSCIDGVRHFLTNPTATPEQSHENWMKFKEEAGWVYGDVKDEVAKTHPCIRPYDELPQAQQTKDHLFSAVVKSRFPAATEVVVVSDGICDVEGYRHKCSLWENTIELAKQARAYGDKATILIPMTMQPSAPRSWIDYRSDESGGMFLGAHFDWTWRHSEPVLEMERDWDFHLDGQWVDTIRCRTSDQAQDRLSMLHQDYVAASLEKGEEPKTIRNWTMTPKEPS